MKSGKQNYHAKVFIVCKKNFSQGKNITDTRTGKKKNWYQIINFAKPK